MTAVFSYLVPVALIGVVVILLLGLGNMLRRDKASRSQKFMRWRVGLQFAAVVVIMAALYFSMAAR